MAVTLFPIITEVTQEFFTKTFALKPVTVNVMMPGIVSGIVTAVAPWYDIQETIVASPVVISPVYVHSTPSLSLYV